MARCQFGGTLAEFVTSASAGPTLRDGTVWTAATGGTQITDLLSISGVPLAFLGEWAVSDGFIRFQGPDDGTSTVWVECSAPARIRLVGVAPLVQVVEHGASTTVVRPVGAHMVIWYGSVAPTNVAAPDLVVRTDEAV